MTGNAYTPANGSFRAPSAGTYVFIVSVDVSTDYTNLGIAKNGHDVTQGHNDGGGSRHIVATCLVTLQENDIITVVHRHATGFVDGGQEAVFLGYKLF